ncbi:MAG: HlyD family efflux transporter periplasmic adaptor subunit [Chlorobi bacterium]|nr:HlyD family efflux transporter periplasmic adaptor subunit [Chlorobiota bacterium]
MKTRHILIFLIGFLSACQNTEEKSDAFGNFETDEVIVSSEANGKLEAFNIDEGKMLKKGTQVGYVDTTDLVLKEKQLVAQKIAIASKTDNTQSQIEVQKQQKKNAMVDKARIENMLKDGAATQKQLDDINGKIDLINKQIKSIKTQNISIQSEMQVINTQLLQLNESIRKSKITNPLNGIVLEKYAEANEIVTFGKPLYKIANLDFMYLRAYVSGAQLPQVKLGQQVEVLIDDGVKSYRSLQGTINWISSTAEFTPKIIQTKEERVNMVYAIKVRVKNDGSLKIGMPGEVNFNAEKN